MYLRNATGLNEIINFGINPLVALLEHFEDYYLDLNDPESNISIHWNLIKGTALSTQDSAKQIRQQRIKIKK
jgi:hypothetical protein